ncbi:MAG: putative DNA binding domain-containing protein [Coriobacteriales bacterium]|jgi:predicted HTH transcriptional regulator|nr:putative DNA binding domain-containing protein [Coriobacteriales bacterium]
MGNEELLADIKCGESNRLEFKRELPKENLRYIKTLVAFANGSGGKLIIGVDNETREIVGVDKPDRTIDSIADALSNLCEPQLFPAITSHALDGKTIISVEVFPGRKTPYFIKSLGRQKGVYVRVGATSRVADAVKVKELVLRGEGDSFDAQVYLDEPLDLKAAEKLCLVIERYKRNSALTNGLSEPKKKVTIKNLENWGLVRRESGELLPTNAFMLMTNNPFKYVAVQCGVFKGTNRAVFVDKREYSGPIYEQVEEAERFVLRNIRLKADFDRLQRVETYELPIAAIREAIVNGQVHRFMESTMHLQVLLFDDRLEVSSPGALYGGLTLEMALAGNVTVRNRVVAETFKQMGLFENWGTGLQRIKESCEAMGLPEPEFQEIGDTFRVNIYREAVPIVEPKGEPIGKPVKLSYNPEQAQEAILALLKESPELSWANLSKALGISRTTLSKHIKKLKMANRLEYVGTARKGHWIVKV